MTTKAQIKNAAVGYLLGSGRHRKIDLDDLYDAAYNIDVDAARLFSTAIRLAIFGDIAGAERKLAELNDRIVTIDRNGSFVASVVAEYKKLRAERD